jgi:ABC-type antimicrobial peptide transport system ATPase subunit
MVDNARTLAGERFDTFISPQAQAAIGQQAIQDGQSAGLTPSQVEQLVEQRMNQFAQAQVQTQYERQIEETLAQHGLQPDTPLATAAIVAASRRSDLDLSLAIREMEDQVLAQAQQIAAKRSEAGSQMGTPIVNGQASTNLAGQNMSPRDRAMARLQQHGLS